MKILKKSLSASLSVSLALLGSVSSASAASYWSELETQTPEQTITSSFAASKHSAAEGFKQARLLQLDTDAMRTALSGASDYAARGAIVSTPASITLPLADGREITVQPIVSQVLPKALAIKYPEIQTFKLAPNDHIISGRVDITPQGFHAMLQMKNGETFVIDPSADSATYASYRKQDQSLAKTEAHQCLLNDAKHHHDDSAQASLVAEMQSRSSSRSTQQLLNYRVAIAATGEYTNLKGGKRKALAAIVTTLNRVNQVYEQDLGIHLTLVDNNDAIIFDNANSDPYSGDSTDLIVQNQQALDQYIGSANYDVGHLFATRGGGLAAIGSVCNSGSKGKGVSGTSNPASDVFNIDFVAHEIGHQLGATHTFNSSQGLCSGRTRTGSTAFEPGSGSTIMSYAGICGSDNLQSHADSMFHIGSIEQIRNNTQTGTGSSCGIRSETGNTSPRPDAGNDYVIPANTPFELQGRATDADGDTLVYAWEQVDAGTTSSAYEDKGNNALFRAHLPNDQRNRVFPPLENILYHRVQKGENLPVKERIMRFKFVAQDGYNAARSDQMQISVKRTGSRFALEMPRQYYTLGNDHQIKWNVANTASAPVHCDEVDVSISTDGGYHFEMIEEGIANTGEASIYLDTSLPETNNARFKLSCSNNIFFAVSFRDFSLTLDDREDAAEVGPEAGLSDRSASVSPSGGSANQSASTPSAGGGAFNPRYLLWALFLIVLRVRRFNKNK